MMQGSVVVWAARVIRDLLKHGEIPQKLTYIVLTLATVVWLYLLYGFLFDHEALPAIYLVMLVSSVTLSLFHFVMLVVSVQTDDSPPEPK